MIHRGHWRQANGTIVGRPYSPSRNFNKSRYLGEEKESFIQQLRLIVGEIDYCCLVIDFVA